METSSTTMFTAASLRLGVHAHLVASLAVAFVSGLVPLGAQQPRVEIARARSLLGEAADSSERQLRVLQRQLDSLARVYTEQDDLTLAERKRVEGDLGRTLKRLEDLSTRLSRSPDEMMRFGSQVRIQMAPQTAERAAASMSRAMMQVHESEQATPRGWIGLVVQGPRLLRVEDGQLFVRYFSYPRVVSVDPMSPAQRAGFTPNDSLLAYDGVDVSENDISFTRLLRPNARVTIRIRRDGKVRDVPVTVAAVPFRIAQRRDDETRLRESWDGPMIPEAPLFPRLPSLAPMPGASMRVTAHQLAPAMAPRAPEGPTPIAPARPAIALSYATGLYAVAGAQLSTIGDGLGRALGVGGGVLVTSAPIGSPANESGLIDGDVISRVAGQSVRQVSDVRDLVALAADNGEHAVALEIVRQKKSMRLVLRW